MDNRQAIVNYLLTYQESLINIDIIRELWMIPDRLMGTKADHEGQFHIETLSPLYRGKLFIDQDNPGYFYIINAFTRTYTAPSDTRSYVVDAVPSDIKYDPQEDTALCTAQDPFILQPGQIANYPDGDPTETTLGIFIANYLLLVYPFVAEIPYINTVFSAGKLEKLIAIRLLDGRITIRDVKDKYINTLSLFGQATEIISPGISEKTITIPKHITELRERLIHEHKDALKAGDASVMSDIEQQLIKAYRQYLEGDPSLHFLLKPKYFNVTLKKLFLTQGMTEVFGSPGEFVFVDNPMGNGWKQEDLPVIFNEVRSGSFSRAIETADGGVIAKLILRVLQDTRIDTDDCGTVRGERVAATKNTLSDFKWNYVINKDGSTTVIDDDNMASFIGQDIVLRTPGYCQAEKGFCAKCFGNLFEKIEQKAFAPVANDFARNQTTSALKKMHGSSHTIVDVSDINRYLIKT